MLNFDQLYNQQIRKQMKEKFAYKNDMEIPKLTAVYLNMGIGDAVADKKNLDSAVSDMTAISGQKPYVTKARKSIATFKLRQNMPIGCKVTLRKKRMYEFLERLVMIALPRSRDFKGFNKKSFDGNGNFSLGLREQIVFPEINYDKIDKVRGINITIATTAKTNEEAKALLEAFNLPFVN